MLVFSCLCLRTDTLQSVSVKFCSMIKGCVHIAVSELWGAFRCSANCFIRGYSLIEQATPSAEQVAFSLELEGPDLGKITLWGSCSMSCDIWDYRLNTAASVQSPIWSSRGKLRKRERSEILIMVQSFSLCYSLDQKVYKYAFSFLLSIFFFVYNMSSHTHPCISRYFWWVLYSILALCNQ